MNEHPPRAVAIVEDLAVLDQAAWARLCAGLEDGAVVTGTVRGRSMWPLLPDRARVQVRRDRRPPRPGEVVAALDGARLVVHRVVEADGRVVLRGDTSPAVEVVRPDDVIGPVVAIEVGRATIRLDGVAGRAVVAAAGALSPRSRAAFERLRAARAWGLERLLDPRRAALRRRILDRMGPRTVDVAGAADAEAWLAFAMRRGAVPSAESVARLFDGIAKGAACLVLARRAGRVVGAARAEPFRLANGRTIDWVGDVLVAVLERGLGAGRRLLDGIEAFARRRGVPTLYAEIHRDNLASIALFLAAGYAPVELGVLLEATGRTETGHVVYARPIA